MSDRQGSDRVSRFRAQNQNTIQELPGRILDNLSANLSEAAIVTRGRGSTRRGAHRSGSARTTPRPGLCRSASSGCSCGPVCSSRAASSFAGSALNPEASAFVPRIRATREPSRNVARRSKPKRITSGLARPVHQPGFVVEPRGVSPPLFPPSYYQAVGEGAREPSVSPSPS